MYDLCLNCLATVASMYHLAVHVSAPYRCTILGAGMEFLLLSICMGFNTVHGIGHSKTCLLVCSESFTVASASALEPELLRQTDQGRPQGSYISPFGIPTLPTPIPSGLPAAPVSNPVDLSYSSVRDTVPLADSMEPTMGMMQSEESAASMQRMMRKTCQAERSKQSNNREIGTSRIRMLKARQATCSISVLEKRPSSKGLQLQNFRSQARK